MIIFGHSIEYSREFGVSAILVFLRIPHITHCWHLSGGEENPISHGEMPRLWDSYLIASSVFLFFLCCHCVAIVVVHILSSVQFNIIIIDACI